MATFKTWEKTMTYVFGSGLQAFEEGHFPKDFGVTRRLIAVDISILAKELVLFWEIHSGLPIKSDVAIGKNFETSLKKIISLKILFLIC